MNARPGAAQKGVSIQLDQIAKRFGDVWAVQPVELGIDAGEMVALLGPSGCGKTTTLTMLAGLIKPSAGGIRFDGESVDHLHPGKRDVGLVFQSYALYPHMTLFDNIAFPLVTQKVPKAQRRERVIETARVLEIENQLHKHPSQVSGGQQQRAALARAIVKQPSVLLLDEPLSNLDAQVRLHARAELRRLQRELGITTLLVTHDQAEALAMADRVAVFEQGRMVQYATPETLYYQPRNTFVAGFVGHPPMNLISGNFEGGRFVADGMSLPLPFAVEDGPGHFGMRPEETPVTLGLSDEAGTIAGEVQLVEIQGRDILATVSLPNGDLAKLLLPRDTAITVGQAVTLWVSRAQPYLFDSAGDRLVRPALAEPA